MRYSLGFVISLSETLLGMAAQLSAAPTTSAFFEAMAEGFTAHNMGVLVVELEHGLTYRVLATSDRYPPLASLTRLLGKPTQGTLGFMMAGGVAMRAIDARTPLFTTDLPDRIAKFINASPGIAPQIALLASQWSRPLPGFVLPLFLNDQPWGFLLLLGESLREEDASVFAKWVRFVEESIGVRLPHSRRAPRFSNAITGEHAVVRDSDDDLREHLAARATLSALVDDKRVASVYDAFIRASLDALDLDAAVAYAVQEGRLVLMATRARNVVGVGFGDPALGSRNLGTDSMMGRSCIEMRFLAEPLAKLPAVTRKMAETSGFLHVCAAPIVYNGKLIGGFGGARVEDRPFDDRMQTRCTDVLETLALAVSAAELVENEHRQEWDLSLVNELSRLVGASLDAEEILRAGAKYIARVADVPNVFMLLRDRDGADALEARASNLDGEDYSWIRLPFDAPSVASMAVRRGEAVAVPDTSQTTEIARALADRFGHSALLAIPIREEREVVGVALLGETRGPRHFTRSEIEHVIAMANQVGAALRNAELFANLRDSYQTLEKAQAQLVEAERLAAIGELSAIMAHEVRNPLGIIFNSLAAMKRAVKNGSDPTWMVDVLEEEADRLNRIVAALLDFARPFSPDKRSVDANEVARGAMVAALSTHQHASDRIRFVSQNERCLLSTDEHLVKQALVNLIENAVHAAGEDGPVEVRVERVVRDARAYVDFVVADEGAGMTDAVRDRIYQPFFTTKPTGTGLGIPIVRRIATALGGEIVFESQSGEGTVARLMLPIDDVT